MPGTLLNLNFGAHRDMEAIPFADWHLHNLVLVRSFYLVM